MIYSPVCFLFQKEDDIPLVEWWDADLLPNRTYADYERDVPPEIRYREISNLVEHPVPVLPIGMLLVDNTCGCGHNTRGCGHNTRGCGHNTCAIRDLVKCFGENKQSVESMCEWTLVADLL